MKLYNFIGPGVYYIKKERVFNFQYTLYKVTEFLDQINTSSTGIRELLIGVDKIKTLFCEQASDVTWFWFSWLYSS